MQKREVTVDSYSESISLNDESSDDRTITTNSDSSAAQSFEDAPYKLETDYELPQVIAQIPSPPMEVSMPIRKALSVDGENKTICYLLCSKYELTNTSWSKLQHKYNVSHNTIYTALTGKGRPRGSQYQQKRKQSVKQEVTATMSSYKTINN